MVILTWVAFALYLANALLALAIVGTARKGPHYWPALTLSSLCTGVPGMFLASLALAKVLPLPDPTPFTTRAGYCLVFALCVMMQTVSLLRVRCSNKEWFGHAGFRPADDKPRGLR